MNLDVINPIVANETEIRLVSESDLGFLTTVNIKKESSDEEQIDDLEIDVR